MNNYIKCKYCNYKVARWKKEKGKIRHGHWKLKQHVLDYHFDIFMINMEGKIENKN